MTQPAFPRNYSAVSPALTERRWFAGSRVLWPNGTEGKVCGVDWDDNTLLDECGAWVDMDDVDLLEAAS